MRAAVRHLILVLGDQLSPKLSSLAAIRKDVDVVVMCEVMEEATYVSHHKKKIAFIFSAMRHFADELRQAGFHVHYVTLDDPGNSGSFAGELARAVERFKPEAVRVTEPAEWRVLEHMKSLSEQVVCAVDILPDERFICSHAEFAAWAKGRKSLTMEYFYRDMRRKTGLLMQDGAPLGGRWNFDSENRKPASPDLLRPRRHATAPDAVTLQVIELVEQVFPNNFGTTAGFKFAVTRSDAERALDAFVEDYLPQFGETQDAMLQSDPVLNHSLISFYLNNGLLDPLSVCRAAERSYFQGLSPLNSVEGFIRQIIGWREYVRGIYWLYMPDYAGSNFFGNTRPLPSFYWTGKTEMNCVATVVSETSANAYAHHIQRLMITGNFAMLAGVDPGAIHRWYLEVYADEYEWVELPNVIGMSQYADGGKLASKPYAASANYISRMSDYCESCHYDPRLRIGARACPFNALYWDFLARNHEKLRGNLRLKQVYATWERMENSDRIALRRQAEEFLARLS
jgi:deoxyribodipyrimidine photolyase-related protein